jgi:hypothetical protein
VPSCSLRLGTLLALCSHNVVLQAAAAAQATEVQRQAIHGIDDAHVVVDLAAQAPVERRLELGLGQILLELDRGVRRTSSTDTRPPLTLVKDECRLSLARLMFSERMLNCEGSSSRNVLVRTRSSVAKPWRLR